MASAYAESPPQSNPVSIPIRIVDTADSLVFAQPMLDAFAAAPSGRLAVIETTRAHVSVLTQLRRQIRLGEPAFDAAFVALDGLYAAAKVTGPLDASGNTTIDLSSLDRRSLFAIATNNGGKFTSDEQSVASTELNNRFNAALAPAVEGFPPTQQFPELTEAQALISLLRRFPARLIIRYPSNLIS